MTKPNILNSKLPGSASDENVDAEISSTPTFSQIETSSQFSPYGGIGSLESDSINMELVEVTENKTLSAESITKKILASQEFVNAILCRVLQNTHHNYASEKENETAFKILKELSEKNSDKGIDGLVKSLADFSKSQKATEVKISAISDIVRLGLGLYTLISYLQAKEEEQDSIEKNTALYGNIAIAFQAVFSLITPIFGQRTSNTAHLADELTHAFCDTLKMAIEKIENPDQKKEAAITHHNHSAGALRHSGTVLNMASFLTGTFFKGISLVTKGAVDIAGYLPLWFKSVAMPISSLTGKSLSAAGASKRASVNSNDIDNAIENLKKFLEKRIDTINKSEVITLEPEEFILEEFKTTFSKLASEYEMNKPQEGLKEKAMWLYNRTKSMTYGMPLAVFNKVSEIFTNRLEPQNTNSDRFALPEKLGTSPSKPSGSSVYPSRSERVTGGSVLQI